MAMVSLRLPTLRAVDELRACPLLMVYPSHPQFATNARRWLDLENRMGLFWKAPIHKTVALLDMSGKRELFWYGVTIGQIGFGVLVSEKRQPAKRATDGLPVCPECKCGGGHLSTCSFNPRNTRR